MKFLCKIVFLVFCTSLHAENTLQEKKFEKTVQAIKELNLTKVKRSIQALFKTNYTQKNKLTILERLHAEAKKHTLSTNVVSYVDIIKLGALPFLLLFGGFRLLDAYRIRNCRDDLENTKRFKHKLLNSYKVPWDITSHEWYDFCSRKAYEGFTDGAILIAGGLILYYDLIKHDGKEHKQALEIEFFLQNKIEAIQDPQYRVQDDADFKTEDDDE